MQNITNTEVTIHCDSKASIMSLEMAILLLFVGSQDTLMSGAMKEQMNWLNLAQKFPS